jgi:acyl-CoA reductase-like NAD-dependent aldehyde dehydrogenase
MTPIAAGCSVILKASELCPRTHFAITEAFHEAGLPAGVLNQIQADRNEAAEVTEALVSSQAIRKIEFIGSANVGRLIGQMSARHLKPVLMELGGKSPAIILEDANLSRAAAMCAEGCMYNNMPISAGCCTNA